MPRPRTWSDGDLREAVASSTTWRQVIRALQLPAGGVTLAQVTSHAQDLSLNVTHLRDAGGGPPRKWTDEQLREAVAASRSLADVFRRLGVAVGGTAWVRMQEHIVRLQLDVSHWDRGSVRPGRTQSRRWRPVAIDDRELSAGVKGARSMAEVLDRLGLDPHNNAHRRRVTKRIATLGLDTDHLRGQAWAKGESPDRSHLRRPLDEVLVKESTYRSTSMLRRRLVEERLLDAHCAVCGIDEWCQAPIVLHLDHINGDPRDNRLRNLRLLCPNCHAQTPTYCGRNIGGGYSRDSDAG